jgi:hypothetical protein
MYRRIEIVECIKCIFTTATVQVVSESALQVREDETTPQLLHGGLRSSVPTTPTSSARMIHQPIHPPEHLRLLIEELPDRVTVG